MLVVFSPPPLHARLLLHLAGDCVCFGVCVSSLCLSVCGERWLKSKKKKKNFRGREHIYGGVFFFNDPTTPTFQPSLLPGSLARLPIILYVLSLAACHGCLHS